MSVQLLLYQVIGLRGNVSSTPVPSDRPEGKCQFNSCTMWKTWINQNLIFFRIKRQVQRPAYNLTKDYVACSRIQCSESRECSVLIDNPPSDSLLYWRSVLSWSRKCLQTGPPSQGRAPPATTDTASLLLPHLLRKIWPQNLVILQYTYYMSDFWHNINIWLAITSAKGKK